VRGVGYRLKRVALMGRVRHPAQPECVIPLFRASAGTCKLNSPANRKQGTSSSRTCSKLAVEYPPVSLSEPRAQYRRIESGFGKDTIGRTDE
jgi:hypothetical protein